jgi:hypothetical protein
MRFQLQIVRGSISLLPTEILSLIQRIMGNDPQAKAHHDFNERLGLLAEVENNAHAANIGQTQ